MKRHYYLCPCLNMNCLGPRGGWITGDCYVAYRKIVSCIHIYGCMFTLQCGSRNSDGSWCKIDCPGLYCFNHSCFRSHWLSSMWELQKTVFPTPVAYSQVPLSKRPSTAAVKQYFYLIQTAQSKRDLIFGDKYYEMHTNSAEHARFH